MKVAKSKNDMTSVMANTKFGPIKITHKDGSSEIIPEKYITENGRIKEEYYKKKEGNQNEKQVG